MQKISSFHLFILEIDSILESWDKIGHTPFVTMAKQKAFNQLLIFVNLYQHAKNQAICSDEMVDL